MIAQLDVEVATLKAKRGKSRVLVDVTGAPTGQRFMAAAKARAPEIEASVDRQAIVGVDGIKSILLRAFNAVSQGTPLKPFSSEQEAKDYLAM